MEHARIVPRVQSGARGGDARRAAHPIALVEAASALVSEEHGQHNLTRGTREVQRGALARVDSRRVGARLEESERARDQTAPRTLR